MLTEMTTNIPAAEGSADMAPRRVLVVGAGGFMGGFFVQKGLELGFEVWAGLRKSTNRERLTDPRIKFIEFDYDNTDSIARALSDALPQGKWDYIIYNLGATKVKRYADFNRINYEYLKSFTSALHSTHKIPEKFLYISSLSVLGPLYEKEFYPFSEDEIPQPNTRYGASKLKAEIWLATSEIPYIIFRPTGIYGPWDRDYFMMFKSIAKGFDFNVGFRPQVLTFIYGPDLADAAYLALEKAPVREIYHITEPAHYFQSEFRKFSKKALGKKFVIPVKMPLWAVKVACAVAEKIGVLRNKPSTLNSDKYRILKQRNWNCDSLKADVEFGYDAKTPLAEGIRQTIEWYRKEGWL